MNIYVRGQSLKTALSFLRLNLKNHFKFAAINRAIGEHSGGGGPEPDRGGRCIPDLVTGSDDEPPVAKPQRRQQQIP